jgi:hypothetical protein
MPRKAEVEDADKKNRLTLAQLAAYDDVSTDVMIDQVGVPARQLFWCSVILRSRSREPGILA